MNIRRIATSLLMLGFVLFLGNDASAQVFVANARPDISVADMTVLKDKYEQHYTATLDKQTLLEKVEVSETNYNQWVAVRNELQSSTSVDAVELQVIEEFVADMASKL